MYIYLVAKLLYVHDGHRSAAKVMERDYLQ